MAEDPKPPQQPLFGGNASEIRRNRRVAELLMNNAFDASPTNPYGAIARLTQGFVGGMKDREADKLTEQRNQYIAEALTGEKTPEQLESLSVQYDAPELATIAGNRYGRSRDAVADQHWQQNFSADQAYRGQQQQNWDQGFQADQGWKAKSHGLQQDELNWRKSQPLEVGGSLIDPSSHQPIYTTPPDPAKPTGDMQEYGYYSDQEKAAGRQPMPFYDYQTGVKRAGASNISNNVGTGEPALRKKLSEKEGESWSGYLDAGNVAASAMQDMQALDELLKVAPQGPIAGRLAEMFPGVSNAGDAAQSIVMRVAPTLRTPGSGSQSDIEYEGALKSLPRLRNSPGGNAMISGVMKAKQQINIERGQIVSAYQNGEIDDRTARQKLQELNQRSIMTPEMKAMLGVTEEGASATNPDIDPLLDKYAPVNQ